MTKLRALILSLVLLAGVAIAAQPAAATTFQVTCWSTSGSPYVSRTGTGSTALNAAVACTRNLGGARWGTTACVQSATIWYYSAGYYYGEATKKQIEYCGYGAASFTTKGYTSSYW